ncbi:hypothetical protein ABW21_db0202338 [Orbilia brochopaga]|nr:hypothetical protein ABW21_db0202338 [Drechslerella brochopaga]
MSSQNNSAPIFSLSSSATEGASNTNPATAESSNQASRRSQIQRPPPVNPLNPLKRQLSDNMEALIAQAKASKASEGSTAAKAAQMETIYEKLERELTCSICCELFKDPVTLLDCLHNFCGSCAVPWAKKNDSCPSCRGHIRGCADAFALKPLIEMLLKERPDLALSEDDMASYREIYKPGQKVSLRGGRDDDVDLEDVFSEDESEEDEFAPEQRDWSPCPCCDGQNPLYVCPEPIFPGDATEPWTTEFRRHRRCRDCERELPHDVNADALRPTRCAFCGNNYCNDVFVGCMQNSTLRCLRETGINGGTNRDNFPLWFQDNAYERGLFMRWVHSDTNNHTMESIGEEMRDWMFRMYGDTIPIGQAANVEPVTRDSYICGRCDSLVWDRFLTDFMISQRERLGWVDNRPNCWYGKNCRTQRHNLDHCARLCHVCAETPQEERRDAREPAGPRPDLPFHVGGVRDNMPAEHQDPAAPESQPPNAQDAPDNEAEASVSAGSIASQASVAGDAGDPGPSN